MSDLLQKLQTYGALAYNAEKIASIEQLSDDDAQKLARALNDNKSPEYRAYKYGQDTAEHELDTMLFELARQGDIKAFNEFTAKRNQRIKQNEKASRRG